MNETMGRKGLAIEMPLKNTEMKDRISDRTFAFIVAFLATALVFSVFVGLKLYSGFVPFQYSGDQLRLCYPAFIKASDLSLQNGVDSEIFNGATEYVFRSNMPNRYPFVILFSLLGRITGYKFAYLLFYAAHMAGYIYFAILLALRFFQLDRKYACLYALSSLSILFSDIFISSWYIVTSLTAPVLYCALRSLNKPLFSAVLQSCFIYVCGFLSGYVPMSFFLCGFTLLLTMVYGFTWRDDRLNKLAVKEVMIKTLLPFLLAVAVVIPYMLQVFIYATKVVQAGVGSLKSTMEIPLLPKDWVRLFSNAFYQMSSLMIGPDIPHLGWSWCVILVLAVCVKGIQETGNGNRYRMIWVKFVAACTLAGLFLASSSNSALAFWFFVVPVLGSLHSPVRYLYIILPFFFLAGAIYLYRRKREDQYMERALWIAAAVTGAALLLLIFKRSYSDKLDENILIVELTMLLISLVILAKHGMSWGAVTFIVLGAVMYQTVQAGYQGTVINEAEYEAFSIVYSESARSSLEEYIDALPESNRYKFVNMDINNYPTETLPNYVPNNIAWFLSCDAELSEYHGYELHLGTPRDYLNRMPWFDVVDWRYVADTRGDFVIVSPSVMATQSEQLVQVIDWEKPTLTLPDGSTVYQIKKFIPSYYTRGGYYVEDALEDELDNGYFYCPYLKKADLLSFETNNASRFTATILSDGKNDIAFTLYPNRYYHYYVDGEEIDPILYDMQVFIPVDSGEHQIEIKYENPMNVVSIAMMSVFYAVTIVVSAYDAVWHWQKKHVSCRK